jgi:hypothetical protein
MVSCTENPFSFLVLDQLGLLIDNNVIFVLSRIFLTYNFQTGSIFCSICTIGTEPGKFTSGKATHYFLFFFFFCYRETENRKEYQKIKVFVKKFGLQMNE